MTFIELCTQSRHPLVHKALERGGWSYSYEVEYWCHVDLVDLEHHEPYAIAGAEHAEPHHEAAVAWELQWELAERGKTLRILPNSTRESVYRDLLRAVEQINPDVVASIGGR